MNKESIIKNCATFLVETGCILDHEMVNIEIMEKRVEEKLNELVTITPSEIWKQIQKWKRLPCDCKGDEWFENCQCDDFEHLKNCKICEFHNWCKLNQKLQEIIHTLFAFSYCSFHLEVFRENMDENNIHGGIHNMYVRLLKVKKMAAK